MYPSPPLFLSPSTQDGLDSFLADDSNAMSDFRSFWRNDPVAASSSFSLQMTAWFRSLRFFFPRKEVLFSFPAAVDYPFRGYGAFLRSRQTVAWPLDRRTCWIPFASRPPFPQPRLVPQRSDVLLSNFLFFNSSPWPARAMFESFLSPAKRVAGDRNWRLACFFLMLDVQHLNASFLRRVFDYV